MGLANFRKVYGKNGSGKFIVSEGMCICGPAYPHEVLREGMEPHVEEERQDATVTPDPIVTKPPKVNEDN